MPPACPPRAPRVPDRGHERGSRRTAAELIMPLTCAYARACMSADPLLPDFQAASLGLMPALGRGRLGKAVNIPAVGCCEGLQ